MLAVHDVGYVRTQSAADRIAAQGVTAIAPSAATSAVKSTVSRGAATPTATAGASRYHDGTYVGTGTCRTAVFRRR